MTKKIILVTGGAGHVGSHLVELLASDLNNQVISLITNLTGSGKSCAGRGI